MHRPTRKLRNLLGKLERKKTKSRKSGAKVKRWKVAVEAYKPLSKDFEGEAPKEAVKKAPPAGKKKKAAAEDEPEAPPAGKKKKAAAEEGAEAPSEG